MRVSEVALLTLAVSCVPEGLWAQSHDLVLETSWGSPGSGPGQFGWPVALEIGSDGLVYVLDSYHPRIQKFTQDGTFVSSFGEVRNFDTGELNAPFGLAVTPSGTVFVSDFFWVHKYDGSGVWLETFDYSTSLPTFVELRGLTSDGQGSLLVTDPGWPRILRISEEGEVRTTVDLSTTGLGRITPYDIALHPNGELFVLDIIADRVVVMSQDFEILRTWEVGIILDPEISEPWGIAVSGDDVFVTDTSWFLRFDHFGNLTGEWGTPNDPDGIVGHGVFGIATAPDGRVFVTTGEHRVLRFGPAPVQTTTTTWGRLKALHR